MKKIFFLLSILFSLSQSSYSQITKGNWLVGGNGSFQSSKTYYPQGQIRVTNINISPNIGYFIRNKIAGGIRLNYSFDKGGSINPPFSKYSSWKIGPFARYYFLNTENRGNLVADMGAAYILHSDNGNHSKGYEYSFMAGPVVFLNSAVGIECLVGYKGGTFESINYNSMFFTIGLQIHLEKD